MSEWFYMIEKAQKSILGNLDEVIESLKFVKELVKDDKFVEAEDHMAFLVKQLEKIRYSTQLINEGLEKEALKTLEKIVW